MMRNRRSWLALVLVVCGAGSAARLTAQPASGEQYAGMWSGTYDGSGTGQFEMTLDKG
jgi:hypothetical protein